MTTKQENRLGMYLAVRDFLQANPDETKDLPEFAAAFDALVSSISELQKIAEMQKFDKTGFAKEKMQLRRVLIGIVHDTSVKLNAYASMHNNVVLQSEVRYKNSVLTHLTDYALRDVARIIYDRAMVRLDVLKEYGITAETLATYQNAMNAYDASVAKPRIGQTEKKQATELLVVRFNLSDDLIEKLDALLEITLASRPNFYSGYRSARKVIGRGSTSMNLRGRAYELPDRTPLKGVKFMFEREGRKSTGIDGEDIIVKRTARKGSFNIKSIPEGTYVVTVTKTGYKQKTLVVSINPGEMETISVEMERA